MFVPLYPNEEKKLQPLRLLQTQHQVPTTLTLQQGAGDRYLNHLYTIEKWHVQQERIQIAESITLY